MSDGWSSITVEHFEVVPAGASRALLRVTGRGPRWRSAGSRPTLVIERGETRERFDPLPAPDDPRGVLRAAYSVPAVLLAGESGFALEHAAGARTELPAPAQRTGRPAAPVATPAPAPVESSELEELRAESGSLREQLEQVHEQLRVSEAERGQLTRRMAELEASLDEAHANRAEAEEANQRLTESLEELETWRGELERRLADITTELGVTKAERDSAREELRSLHETRERERLERKERDLARVSRIAERRALQQAEAELHAALGD